MAKKLLENVKKLYTGGKLENKFLLVAIILGILFIVVLPPGQSPDDINHYRRAYAISKGVLVAGERIDDDGAVGSSLPIEIEGLEKLPSKGSYERVGEAIFSGDSGEETEQAYTSAALYNFVCYLPQALGALVGRVLNFSVMGTAYLMRIFNFVVWVLLMYFAIKILPKFKIMAVFVALFPITLQEATSLSPDALTIGLSFFLVAYVLNLAYSKKGVMEKHEIGILYALAILIGLCKIVYFPLVLLYLVIPEERFGSKKRRWMHLGIIAGVSVLINLVWLAFSSGLLTETNPGVDSKEQLLGIVKNPFRYLVTILKTINAQWQLWLYNMFGILIGAFSFNLPGILFVPSFAIFVLLLAQRDESLELKKFDRCIFMTTFFSIVFLIFTSLYLQWTAVGASQVDGIQGRYFLPILMLIPLMICRKKKTKANYPTLVSPNFIVCYSAIIGIVACVTIFTQNI